jgi:site-specific DNA-methyltransferase (cytosine-N4-specific)
VGDRFTIDFEKIFFFTKQKQYFFEPLRQPHSDVSLARIEKPWHGKLTKGHALGGLKSGDMSQMCHPEGRNMRTVWSVNTGSNPDEHFAVFPEELAARMISSGCPERGGVVLDPFMGSGTTGLVARKLGRNYLGIELNPEYIKMAEARIRKVGEPLFP